jgi:hypothetical protein
MYSPSGVILAQIELYDLIAKKRENYQNVEQGPTKINHSRKSAGFKR